MSRARLRARPTARGAIRVGAIAGGAPSTTPARARARARALITKMMRASAVEVVEPFWRLPCGLPRFADLAEAAQRRRKARRGRLVSAFNENLADRHTKYLPVDQLRYLCELHQFHVSAPRYNILCGPSALQFIGGPRPAAPVWVLWESVPVALGVLPTSAPQVFTSCACLYML